MKTYFTVWILLCLAVSPSLWACEVGIVATPDKALDLMIMVASAECSGKTDRHKLVEFFTGESVAMEIRVLPRSSLNGAKAELLRVDLRRNGDLRAPAVPGVRKMSDGIYFVDNIEFSAPGTWALAFTLRRSGREEIVTFSVSVKLSTRQAAEAITNTSKVPNFSFKDPYGNIITQKDLLGRVWIADFFFTKCPQICPLMAQKLAVIQEQFKNETDFRLLSVTTDPENDTPEVLKSFAKRHRADMDRWFFLRGEKKAVVAFSANGLKLDVTVDSVMHSTRVVVVDRKGNIRGTYDSMKIEELEQLKLVVKDLLAVAAEGKL